MQDEAPKSGVAPVDPAFLHDRYQKLVEMYRQDWTQYDSVEQIRSRLTEFSAELLNVNRVGIWHYTSGREAIVCVDHFQRDKGIHSSGTVLHRREFPQYFAAIDTDRIVSANNAVTDPRTKEFTASYLTPNGIGAMLDAPVIAHGVTIGVFCNEHVGSPRLWTPEEEQLARSITDIAAYAESEWNASRSEVQLKKLERMLADAQRLEEVGLMTAKLAHDFNNLIAPIKGWAEYATLAEGKDDLRMALDHITSGANRATELVDSLLQFVRRKEPEKSVLDIGALTENLANFLRNSLNREIRLTVSVPKEAVPVSGNAAQLQQVIVNLVRNAADAIGSRRGRIDVTARIINAGEHQVVPNVPDNWISSGGPVVVLAIRDDGTGITPQNISKVFDPMFSTKSTGNGLGLAAARKILRDHDGDITVSSRPGDGTVFTLYLPVARGSS